MAMTSTGLEAVKPPPKCTDFWLYCFGQRAGITVLTISHYVTLHEGPKAPLDKEPCECLEYIFTLLAPAVTEDPFPKCFVFLLGPLHLAHQSVEWGSVLYKTCIKAAIVGSESQE